MARPSLFAEGAIVVLWVLLAPALLLADRELEFRKGANTRVDVTLVPSDADNLSCALDGRPYGMGCGFDTSGRALPPAPQGTLVPCMTTERKPLLVPDLFEQPEVARRVATARAENRMQERFTAHCHVKVLHQLAGVRTRYRAVDPFGGPSELWLVKALSCTVRPDGR